MFDRHKHDWNLIDKTLVPPAAVQGKLKFGGLEGSASAVERMQLEQHAFVSRMTQGYVVLTFKCDCGEIRIEEP